MQLFVRYQHKNTLIERKDLSQFIRVFYNRQCFAALVKPLIFALPAEIQMEGLLQVPLLGGRKLEIINNNFGRIRKVHIFACPNKRGVRK
jgi:hypothetical protein